MQINIILKKIIVFYKICSASANTTTDCNLKDTSILQ